MQSGRLYFLTFWTASMVVAFSFPYAACAQSDQQQVATKSSVAAAPKHDLSGVWQLKGTGSAENFAPEQDMPPMTPWAKAKFDAAKPGYGPRATPDGNDPILQCDPIGIPRILFMPVPYEFVQTPGRVLQFFEREHEWRSIWMDGRSFPKDPDPTWFGYAIGHWEGDTTLVVESTGFTDRTWITPTGYPHSEAMHVSERYQRLDGDTILYDITVTDPMSYTRPIPGPQRIMKRRPGGEIGELPCVWSEENEFAKRIRAPAASQPAR